MDSKKMAAELPLKKPIGKSHPTKVYHAIEKRNTALPNAYVYQVSIGKTQQTVPCASLFQLYLFASIRRMEIGDRDGKGDVDGMRDGEKSRVCRFC